MANISLFFCAAATAAMSSSVTRKEVLVGSNFQPETNRRFTAVQVAFFIRTTTISD